jgi:hypothetical protein
VLAGARVRQLYAQEREKPFGSSTLGAYVRRWLQSVRAGFPTALRLQLSVCSRADP